MAAQAERSLQFLAHAGARERTLTALYGCIALVAVAIGVLGLIGASWPRQMLESWINIHALFGLLLCGLVFSRWWWRVKHSPRMLPADIRELSRHLSRILYLLLYLVIGVRQLLSILDGIWHGGAVDFNLFDERFRNGPDSASWNPKDDFQLFLATGFSVLIIVRVVAFRLWLRSVERSGRREETAR
jgi:cytochrome b561